MTESLLLASTNPGKLAELTALLARFQGRILTPDDLGLDLHVPEDGAEYADNASAKARAFASAASLWALADDTGLEVDALDGWPGVHSARQAPTDSGRRAALLERLSGHPRPWTARFRCALVLAGPSGELAVGHGVCEGEVVPTARGTMGFGYDPIFLLRESHRTMAELPLETKNRLSHRARALADLGERLQRNPLPGAPLLPAPA